MHCDDDEVVVRVDRLANGEAAQGLVELARGERVRSPQESHQVAQDEEETEGDEELVLLGALVEGPEQRRLENRAQPRRGKGAHRQESVEGDGGPADDHGPHRPRRHIRTEGVEHAVGEIDDAHDPVDQRQATCDQEEHGGVEQRGEHVDDQIVHGVRVIRDRSRGGKRWW